MVLRYTSVLPCIVFKFMFFDAVSVPPPTLLFDPCPSPAIATLCLKAMAFDSFSTNVKLIRLNNMQIMWSGSINMYVL